ncbi:Dihydroneopterin aldolase [Leifsonia rubra CMS 76R]|uniref:7,8-dihydroneopterin aldolase n=1 Tax=Rhodoglobus vestalii TaxID=193384 RepID=A0A8H2K7U6_9MICO|nr:dihydroneopterin aldolase [Rhodoglobus vestalii]EPR75167.1 Dihydroneopterin aldolase [Leifsonia rubra CMS 76R]TQO20284.1 dihydroneopterin aldolase [Rhodoglobus vestalii]
MNPALDELTLTGLRATAFHGVFDHERRDGQVFIVDAVVYLDLSPAALSDQLNRTVHYGELAEQIVAAVESNPVDLIETVAERVANIVLAYDAAVSTKITIHKPSAPITVPFADVAVTITRHRPASAHPAGFSAEPHQLS